MTAATSLLLFGATGDLSRRMLIPSLFGLHGDGLLHPELRIIGTARSTLDSGSFRELAAKALEQHLEADRRPPAAVASFLDRLAYVPLDASRTEGFAALAAEVGDPCRLAIFLSTAPSLFGSTIAGLSSAGLACAGARLALEKPLGHDLASSRAINDAVAAAYPESQIVHIDHYLGKENV